MTGAIDRCEQGLAWRESGAGPNTVVLLHGLDGSRTGWDPQLERLAPLARTVAWDLPGYGASDPMSEPMTFEALAAAVTRLVALLGATDVHLVGHSFGGMVAQYTAVHHSQMVRSLTLLSTSPAFGLDGTRPADWRAARLAPLDAGQTPTEMAPLVLGAISGPNITRAALGAQIAAMSRISADGLRRTIDCLITHDTRALLGGISAPTIVAVGQLDDETPPSYSAALAAGIAGARLVEVPGAGHLLPAEAPDAVSALIAQHLHHEGLPT